MAIASPVSAGRKNAGLAPREQTPGLIGDRCRLKSRLREIMATDPKTTLRCFVVRAAGELVRRQRRGSESAPCVHRYQGTGDRSATGIVISSEGGIFASWLSELGRSGGFKGKEVKAGNIQGVSVCCRGCV